jgi:hypothetical protein
MAATSHTTGWRGAAQRATGRASRFARRLLGGQQARRTDSRALVAAYASLVAEVDGAREGAQPLTPASVAAMTRSHFATVQAEVDTRGIELVESLRAGQDFGEAFVAYARASARGTASEAARALPVIENVERDAATGAIGRVALGVWRFWRSPAAEARAAFDHAPRDFALRVAALEYCIALWPDDLRDARQLVSDATQLGGLSSNHREMLEVFEHERADAGGALTSLLRGHQDNVPVWVIASGPCLPVLVAFRAGFPDADRVEPIFVGFACPDLRALTPESVAYLREAGPVGCHDDDTLELLTRCGVPSFLSGPFATAGRDAVDAAGAPGFAPISSDFARSHQQPHMTDETARALAAIVDAISAERPAAQVRAVWQEATSELVARASATVAAIAP